VPGTPEQATLTIDTSGLPANIQGIPGCKGFYYISGSGFDGSQLRMAPKTWTVSPGTYTITFAQMQDYTLISGNGSVTLAAGDSRIVTGVYTVQPTASLSISASPPGTTSYKVGEDRYVVIYPRVVGNASWLNGNVSGNGLVTITTTVNVNEGQYHVEGSATTTKTVSNGEDFTVDYQVGLSVLGTRLGRWFDVMIDAHLSASNGASSDAHTQYQVYLYW